MSAEKNSVHVRLSDDQDAQLEVLADLGGTNKAALAASLLAKAIAGEFHDFRLAQDKYMRVGTRGSGRE